MIAFPRGPVTIEIAEGDITRQTVDAIVNAANNHLMMGQIDAHARTPTSLRRVALVLLGDPAFRAFERVAREVLFPD